MSPRRVGAGYTNGTHQTNKNAPRSGIVDKTVLFFGELVQPSLFGGKMGHIGGKEPLRELIPGNNACD